MNDYSYQDEVARKWKQERDELLEVVQFYASKRNWGEPGSDLRGWYLIESKDRGDKARAAIAKMKGSQDGK